MKEYIYQNTLINKKQLKELLAWSFSKYDSMQASLLADELKYLGFKYATQAGISISIEDLKVPVTKNEMLEKANKDISNAEKICLKGKITDVERFQKIIDTWSIASESLKDNVVTYFKTYDPLNSVYIMAFSGARGNLSQVRQLVGMRGLMADPSGEIMRVPIKKNFREGLTITDYLMSGYGARKGIVDTALKTANSGYLTRRLIDIAQDIIIREKDCSTSASFIIDYENKLDVEQIIGRILAKPVYSPKTQELIAPINTHLTLNVLNKFKENQISKFHIRSPLTCSLYHSICQMCYGWDLSNQNLVDLGEAVGILAGQSIGEPGTQLTMRTFHTGGVVGLDITSGLPRIVELFEARTPKGKSVLSPIQGKVKSVEVTPEGNRNVIIGNEKEDVELLVLRRQTMLINQGDTVEAGQSLTTGPKDPKEVLQINGVRTCQEYLVDEVQKTYRDQGVEVHDKHVEMIVRQMLRRVRIVKSNNSDFLPNELVDSTLFRKTNQELVKDGKVPAEGRPELMGITKASLATDSWLSAASFQETTRVLTEAAMKRSNDSLSGLKENVIIGTLIPAGTGSNAYQSMKPSLPDAPEVSELGFMASTSEDSEDEALPNPAQWLAMLGDENEVEDE